MQAAPLQFLTGCCRIVKEIGQGTRKEKARGGGASVSYWSGGYEQRAVFKVSQGEERMDRIKAFLVLSVAELHLAIMPRCVRTNELVLDTKIMSSFLKKGLNVPFTVGKTVGKFKTVVSLDTFHKDALAGIPLHQPFQEAGGGVGGLIRIGRQETEPGELVNGGILKQA